MVGETISLPLNVTPEKGYTFEEKKLLFLMVIFCCSSFCRQFADKRRNEEVSKHTN